MEQIRSAALAATYMFVSLFVLFSFMHIISIMREYFKAKKDSRKSAAIDYKEYLETKDMIPVSIIIPAHNNADIICDSIDRALSIEYGDFEVIVVDDGSNDATIKNIIDKYELEKIESAIRYTIPTKNIMGVYFNSNYPSLLCVSKEHGGIADAINCGINASRFPLYIAIQPNSVYEKNAILKLSVEFFSDSSTVMSCGINGIKKPSFNSGGNMIYGRMGYLESMQMAECLRWTKYSNSYDSLFSDAGTFALFNKQVILDLNGYRVDSEGFHYDMIVRINKKMLELKRKHYIVRNSDVVCEVPSERSIGKIISKTFRWQSGVIDVFVSNIKNIFNIKKYKSLAFASLPFNLFYNILFPVLECIAYITFPVLISIGQMESSNMLYFGVIYVAVNVVITLSAYMSYQISNKKYIKPLSCFLIVLFSFFEMLVYRQIMIMIRTIAVLHFRLYRESYKSKSEKIDTDKTDVKPKKII